MFSHYNILSWHCINCYISLALFLIKKTYNTLRRSFKLCILMLENINSNTVYKLNNEMLPLAQKRWNYFNFRVHIKSWILLNFCVNCDAIIFCVFTYLVITSQWHMLFLSFALFHVINTLSLKFFRVKFQCMLGFVI